MLLPNGTSESKIQYNMDMAVRQPAMRVLIQNKKPGNEFPGIFIIIVRIKIQLFPLRYP